MSEIVKGFQTTEGVKQYDYNSLANKPDLSTYVPKSEVVSDPQPGKILRLNNEGVLPADIAGKASSVEWQGVENKPNSLEGYGLQDEVYNKTEIDRLLENAGANIEVDATLTEEGKAADAKAVGDAIGAMNYMIASDDGSGVVTLSLSPLASSEGVGF